MLRCDGDLVWLTREPSRIRSHGGWWPKTQARNRGDSWLASSASLPCCPGISMLGDGEEKESNVTKEGTIESYRNVIKYFQEKNEYI